MLKAIMQNLFRFLVILACTALVVIAEDFWVKKPYSDWTDKDAAKLLQNSPWTHEVSISAGPSSESTGGGGGRGRRGGGGGSDMGGIGGPASGGGDAGGSTGAGIGEPGGSGMGRSGRGGEMGGGGGVPSVMVRVRWQSALPVRQALVLTQLGREKADSEQAKKFLDQEMTSYVVAIVGLPMQMGQMPPERLNEMAKRSVSLVRKDKDPIAAESAVPAPKEKAVYFVFPKTSPITLEDKEVEFVAKVGQVEVKRKFKLKDMVIGEKLEL